MSYYLRPYIVRAYYPRGSAFNGMHHPEEKVKACTRKQAMYLFQKRHGFACYDMYVKAVDNELDLFGRLTQNLSA